jgi:hypothetical protein
LKPDLHDAISRLTVNAFDGTRQMIGADVGLLTAIPEGNGKDARAEALPALKPGSSCRYDNLGDNF